MDSKFEIHLPSADSSKMDQAERLRSINGALIRGNARLHTKKMGEITLKTIECLWSYNLYIWVYNQSPQSYLSSIRINVISVGDIQGVENERGLVI